MEVNQSITSLESREWLAGVGFMKAHRYLRRNHKEANWPLVKNLLYWCYPDEGRKLAENFDKFDFEKKQILVKWIVHQPQITCLILGDQRMGKDALICQVFEDVIEYCRKKHKAIPRFVTLGNVRCPPFVKEEDMHFSFRKIPSGTQEKPVYIYCSELESVLQARETGSPENKLFSVLEGTLAQNHQKLFGAVKLSSKVDLNVIRSCNLKLFKYISKEKLEVEGVERVNFLSDLGRWLLPKDKENKRETLMVFDNQLLTTNFDLPKWWTDEYSEQFRDVPIEKVWDYILSVLAFDSEKLTNAQINVIQTAVFQKFRKEISRNELLQKFNNSG